MCNQKQYQPVYKVKYVHSISLNFDNIFTNFINNPVHK